MNEFIAILINTGIGFALSGFMWIALCAAVGLPLFGIKLLIEMFNGSSK